MDYQIKQLTRRSWRISSPLGVYADLFIGEKRALLWDTAYGMGDLKGTVRQITDLPLYIVNSHGHVDHACGNSLFSEPVYIHPADMELCRIHTDRFHRALALEYARSLSEDFDRDVLSRAFDTEAYCGSGTGDLVPVTEGHVFDLGGTHLRVVELPGHTMGSIGLLYEEEGSLYAGDAVNGFLWLFLPEAAGLSTYIRTIHKIMDLAPGRLVLSHLAGAADPSVLSGYLALAEDPDYENGIPYTAPLVPGATARMCYGRGHSKEEAMRGDIPVIVLNRDHLDL